MKTLFRPLAIVAALLVGAALRAQEAEDPRSTKAAITVDDPAGLQKLLGTWDFEGSTEQVVISRNSQSQYFVAAKDQKDGEQFWVSKMRWDGRKLVGKFMMPSTLHTTFLVITLTGPDRLKAAVTGDVERTLALKRHK